MNSPEPTRTVAGDTVSDSRCRPSLRLRFWRGIALAVTFLVITLLGWNVYLQVRLSRALAPLRLAGAPLTLDELSGARDIDPAANAAARYVEAFVALGPLLDSADRENDLPLVSGKLMPPLGAAFLDDERAHYVERLAPYRDALDRLRLDTATPDCQYDVDRTVGYNRALTWTRPLRGAVAVLCLRAALAADAGDSTGSTDFLVAALRLGESVRRERGIFPYSVRLSCRAMALHTIEWANLRAVPTPSDAQRLLVALRETDDNQALVDSFLSEQCIGVVALSALDSANSSAFDGVDGGWSPYERRLFCSVGLDKLELVRFLDASQPMARALMQPLPDRLGAVRQIEATEYRAIAPQSLVIGLLYPGALMVDMDCDRLARRRSAELALRLLLLPPGESAVSRDAMSDAAMAAPVDAARLALCADPALTDPYSGRALRFGRDAAGPFIYSVGTNLVDDGGSNRTTVEHGSPLDLLYRLPVPPSLRASDL